MSKYIVTIIIALACSIHSMVGSAGNSYIAPKGQWVIHNSFNHYIREVTDSPNRVFILAAAHYFAEPNTLGTWGEFLGQLHIFDKASGQITAYNATNKLSGNIIKDIAYNPVKGYLTIVYKDLSIDLLYDDDTLCTIHTLATSTIDSKKSITSINFDPENDKIYLAAEFGYAVIDDNSHTLCELNKFYKPLTGVARVGENIILTAEDGLYVGAASAPPSSIADFSKVSDVSTRLLTPLSGSLFGYDDGSAFYTASIASDGSLLSDKKIESSIAASDMNRDGYFLRQKNRCYQLFSDGSLAIKYTSDTPNGDLVMGSWDMTDFYVAVQLKGLQKMSSTGEFSWAADMPIYPVNSMRPAATTAFAASPEYGMIVATNTLNRFYNNVYLYPNNYVSAYKAGKWDHHGSLETPTASGKNIQDTYDVMLDPDGKHIWIGSLRRGLLRFDLNDKTCYRYGNSRSTASSNFAKVFPYSSHSFSFCNISTPSFDRDGNLWCIYGSLWSDTPEQPIFCWPREARENGDVSAFKNVPVQGYEANGYNHICLATKHERTNGFLAFTSSNAWCYESPIQLLYHAGTPTDTSDDKLMVFNTLIDQNNNNIEHIFLNNLFEDNLSGNVWILTDTGISCFDPAETLSSTDTDRQILRVYRPTVDGSYLLDGFDVLCATTDGQGRKWFGTNTNGIFVTTPECDKILYHITTDNSKLVSDIIYSLAYEPATNAMWIGTECQTCTLYIDADTPEGDDSDILAFPNPVRPDYQGYVSIRGLRSGNPVRILDAHGTLICDLGTASAGSTVWDLTYASGTPVASGIYYIHNDSSDFNPATATRIQVMR